MTQEGNGTPTPHVFEPRVASAGSGRAKQRQAAPGRAGQGQAAGSQSQAEPGSVMPGRPQSLAHAATDWGPMRRPGRS